MLFITEKRKDLRIYGWRLAKPIVFENGRYETFDLDEIAALERNPYVTRALDAVFDRVEVTLSEDRSAEYEDLTGLDEIRFTDASGGTRFAGRVTSEDEGDAGPASAD